MFSLFKPNTNCGQTTPGDPFTLHTDPYWSSQLTLRRKACIFPKCRTSLVSFSITFFCARNQNQTVMSNRSTSPQKKKKKKKSWPNSSQKKLKNLLMWLLQWHWLIYAREICKIHWNAQLQLSCFTTFYYFTENLYGLVCVNPGSACLHRCFHSFWHIIVHDWHLPHSPGRFIAPAHAMRMPVTTSDFHCTIIMANRIHDNPSSIHKA